MSALEIVLISVLGTLVLLVVLYYFLLTTNNQNRLQIFKVLNEDPIVDSIVFFGDSLTDFFPLQDFFPDQKIYNRGIAADTTKKLLKRIHNIIEIKPRKVFLQIGTNDLGKGIKVKKVVDNIIKICEILESEIPGVEVIVISLYPVSHRVIWLSPIISGLRTNNKIREVNHLLKEKCQEKGRKYLDIHQKLITAKGRLKKEYTIEGLHISGLGYKVIAEEIRPHL